MDPRPNSTEARRLARLLGPADDGPTIYHGADPAVILRHQLEAPLTLELSSPLCGAEERAEPLKDMGPSLRTFGDLFHHSNPPIELLRRAKDFAKSCRAYPELLPPEVATLLYYTAIAVARLRHEIKISEMEDADLKKGLQWGIDQPWVDERTRGLLRAGFDRLA